MSGLKENKNNQTKKLLDLRSFFYGRITDLKNSLRYPKSSGHLLNTVFSFLLDIQLHPLVQLQKKSIYLDEFLRKIFQYCLVYQI